MAEGIRVLLVDDERLVRRSMEKSLLRAGFDVEACEDAQQGLQAFEEALQAGTPFDIAVLDLHMPDLAGRDNPDAGLELLGALLERQATLPVVILTAFDEVGRAKRAVEMGARAYFVKGREAGLIELINDILDLD